jgi:hypothetical protein
MPTPQEILIVASTVANQTPGFWIPNAGVAIPYLDALEQHLNDNWPNMFEREQPFDPAMITCAFDFYYRDQQMAIEIALSSHGANTEYFKDIWKAILARREGSLAHVNQLLIIGKHPNGHQGFVNRHNEPFPNAILNHARNCLGLKIHLLEIQQQ